jgi:hypothetical protein
MPGWGRFGEELAGEFEADTAVGWRVWLVDVVRERIGGVVGDLPPVISATSFLSVMVGLGWVGGLLYC